MSHNQLGGSAIADSILGQRIKILHYYIAFSMRKAVFKPFDQQVIKKGMRYSGGFC